MELQGKTALITGVNRGIGLAILKLFVKEGANIIACMRSKDDDFELELQRYALKYNVSLVQCYFDLKDDDSVKEAFHDIYRNKYSIDILVNNAGVVSKGFLQMTKIDSIKEMFQINFFSQILITQYVLKIMQKAKHGSIINMGSIGGIDAHTANLSYGCSKAALMYFTKTLSQEYAQYNIRVNTIAPGMVDTNMAKEMGETANNEILSRCALKRLAKPEEIAQLALFLASDNSSFITGQTIRIDGGM
jgi:3-oxoacyl-[acyl-carrier protein] reductase